MQPQQGSGAAATSKDGRGREIIKLNNNETYVLEVSKMHSTFTENHRFINQRTPNNP